MRCDRVAPAERPAQATSWAGSALIHARSLEPDLDDEDVVGELRGLLAHGLEGALGVCARLEELNRLGDEPAGDCVIGHVELDEPDGSELAGSGSR